MILITGTPRSGTSMLMQTLCLLGIEITGEKFSNENLPKHNTKGYWELPHGARRNLQSDYKGKAVKLLGEDFDLLNPDHVEKIIFITRYNGNASKSLVKYLKTNDKITFAPSRINAEKLIEYSLKVAYEFMRENPEIPRMEITFEKILNEPEREIKKLCEFLDIEFNQKAVDNIGA